MNSAPAGGNGHFDPDSAALPPVRPCAPCLSMEARTRSWRPGSRSLAVAAALLVAAVVASESLRTAFFFFFLAYLLAVLLDYPVRFVARVVPRSVAAGVLLVVVLGGLAGAVRFAVPTLADQGSRVVERAPAAVDRVERWWNRVRFQSRVESVPTGQQIGRDVADGLTRKVGTFAQAALPIAATTASLLGSVVLLLILATFMVADPRGYADGIVWVVPPEHERATRELLARIVHTTRVWLYAQLLSMTFVGVCTAAGLYLIGVNGWLALGAVNFLCEFVPYLGPFVGAAPGIAAALAESGSKGAWAALLYLGIQQLEGYLVSPLVMRHEVKLAPPLLLLWQVLMGTAFGVLGIVVATPLLACVKTAVDYLWVERTLGRKPAVAEGNETRNT